MTRKNPCLLTLSALILLLGLQAPGQGAATSPKITYHLSIGSQVKHLFHVDLEVKSVSGDKVNFAIPAWTPGYYTILNYEKNIQDVIAQDDKGQMLPVKNSTPRTWEVQRRSGKTGNIRISYNMLAEDGAHGFFGSMISSKLPEAYVNGASLFLYMTGHTADRVSLDVKLPTGWQLATPLTPESNNPANLRFTAKNYDEFIDCPLQMGKFDSVQFTAAGVPFRCVFVGGKSKPPAELGKMLKKIAEEEIRYMGVAPFRNYMFLFHFNANGYGGGGLEHHNSTVITFYEVQEADDEGFLHVAAHELFHAWNVKRLRPEGLGPFNYADKVRSPSLWFAEGVTDYISYLILARIGIISPERFQEHMSGSVNRLQHNNARLKVSLREASLKSWEGFSMGFGGLDYYQKGALVGLYMDIRLRQESHGRHSLEDVLRWLDKNYGLRERAYPESAIVTALQSESGGKLRAEYETLVDKAEEVPWERVLPDIGLTLSAGNDQPARWTTGKSVELTPVLKALLSSSAAHAGGNALKTPVKAHTGAAH